jgi:CubicO group peptidase (beta-lactamase class C family)
MQMRGVEQGQAGALHLMEGMVAMLMLIAAMVLAATTLGARFRLYTIATIIAFLGFAAWSGMEGPRIEAGLATPWVGVKERVAFYSYQLWFIALAMMLPRRSRSAVAVHTRTAVATNIGGMVAPGFEEVRAEFERNFAERGELGGAVAAYWRCEKVVDLWGGSRTPDADDPWKEDTMVVAMSSTKGIAALTLAVANARGLIDYEAPVARYWPEFAQNGKAGITVRQLLGHEAGLVLLDEDLTMNRMRDLDDVARLLARQKPAWPPGTRHGYHLMSLGLYMQELIRHVDPARRTFGQFFLDEVAKPLGAEFYIGLPRDVPDERLAKVKTLSVGRAILGLRKTPLPMIRKTLRPNSVVMRSFLISDLDWNDRRMLEIELPAGNGVGTARAMARIYSAFAEGGGELGITPETFDRVTAPPVVANAIDVVLGLPSYFSLGFLRGAPEGSHGWGPRAVGAPGAGGSFAFADPDARLGYAYLMNKLDFYLVDDPREKALRDAIYRAIGRLGDGAVEKRSTERREAADSMRLQECMTVRIRAAAGLLHRRC